MISIDCLKDQITESKEHYFDLGVLDRAEPSKKEKEALAKKTGAVYQLKLKELKERLEKNDRETFDKYLRENLTSLYEIYKNSFGGIFKQGEQENPLPFKILIDESTRRSLKDSHLVKNFGAFDESSVGCVLNFSRWNLLINDIIFMGAAHGQQEIIVNEPEIALARGNLWDSTEDRLRVTGREIVLLHTAGYKAVKRELSKNPGDLHFHLIPDPEKPEAAKSLTLARICEEASKVAADALLRIVA